MMGMGKRKRTSQSLLSQSPLRLVVRLLRYFWMGQDLSGDEGVLQWIDLAVNMHQLLDSSKHRSQLLITEDNWIDGMMSRGWEGMSEWHDIHHWDMDHCWTESGTRQRVLVGCCWLIIIILIWHEHVMMSSYTDQSRRRMTLGTCRN